MAVARESPRWRRVAADRSGNARAPADGCPRRPEELGGSQRIRRHDHHSGGDRPICPGPQIVKDRAGDSAAVGEQTPAYRLGREHEPIVTHHRRRAREVRGRNRCLSTGSARRLPPGSTRVASERPSAARTGGGRTPRPTSRASDEHRPCSGTASMWSTAVAPRAPRTGSIPGRGSPRSAPSPWGAASRTTSGRPYRRRCSSARPPGIPPASPSTACVPGRTAVRTSIEAVPAIDAAWPHARPGPRRSARSSPRRG